MNDQQGLDLFLSLLRSTEERVRVVALQAIGKLLRSGVAIDPHELFPAMYRILKPYPFTNPVYTALFSIMLSEDLQGSSIAGSKTYGILALLDLNLLRWLCRFNMCELC